MTTTETIATFEGRPSKIAKVSSARYTKQLAELTVIAEKFLKGVFFMDLDIPLQLNGRLTKANGRFVYREFASGPRKGQKVASSIQINTRYLQLALLDGERGWDNVVSTLKHELTHYALFEQGKDFNDGDATFEMELKLRGIHSSGTMGYNLVYTDKNGKKWSYNNWDKSLVTTMVEYAHK